MKTFLDFSLACLCGLRCLVPDMKTMEKFKEGLSCEWINFWNILNQDGSLYLQLYSELLMSLQISFPFCIIKEHTYKKTYIQKNIHKTYKRISDQIKYKDILTKIDLVTAVIDIFNGFLGLFQMDESWIMSLTVNVSLILTVMARFLQWEVYAKMGSKELPGIRIARCN